VKFYLVLPFVSQEAEVGQLKNSFFSTPGANVSHFRILACWGRWGRIEMGLLVKKS